MSCHAREDSGVPGVAHLPAAGAAHSVYIRDTMPLVTFLMPVRNAAPWLESALSSLARQTMTDHEIVAIDDGSTDATPSILDAWTDREPRLRAVRQEAMGLPAALEHGRRLANSPWIARQDADDLSHRTRLERQLEFADRHPETDIVGTGVRLFPAASTGVGMRRWIAWHNTLLTHDAIAREVLIDSPLVHGTALLRQQALDRVNGWQECDWAEDLDLWVRSLEAGARFGKVKGPLYSWRQHPLSSTRTDSRYSRDRFTALKLAALDRGLLAGGRQATLIGVGKSLARWRAALGARLAAVCELRTPPARMEALLSRPLIIVLMSPVARERWRYALTAAGALELRDFIFVI